MESVTNEDVASRVAQALKKSLLDQLFKAVAKIDLQTESFVEIFRGLRGEGDRSLAIVSFAYIDERLRDLFEQAINPDITGGPSSLLDGVAPLSSSSARIQVAAALYWIGPVTYRNLGILRKIRNEFAHVSTAAQFSHRRIAGLLSSMDPVEKSILDAVAPDTMSTRVLSDRERFYVRCVATCQVMIMEMATAPTASRMGLEPRAMWGLDLSALPQEFTDLTRSAATVMLEYLGIE